MTTPAAFTLFLAVGGLCLSCSNRGSVAVGGACRADESCVTGVCIPEASTASSTAWSGGYCSGNCATTTCPQGLCLTLADGRSYCVSECAGDGDCRAGYVCSAGVGACLPDCRLGWSCGASLVCDMATGACTLPMPVSGNTSLGSACTINLECATGMCIPERSGNGTVAWTGGLCSQECASAACPAGSACAPMEDGSAYCVPVCASPADCRAGYVCDVEIAGCLPDCRLGWSCGTQLVCDASNGSCVSPAHADAGTRDGGAADSGQGDAGGRGDNDAGGFGPGDAGGFGPDDVGGRGDNDAGGFGPGGDDAGRGSGASPGGMWATGPQPLR